MSKLSDFDYVLPTELIAQFPAENRTSSRLLVATKSALKHENFLDFLSYVNPGDLLIFNDTKVIPARLFGQKESGGKIDCLIERVLSDHSALAHIRASHAPKLNSKIILAHNIEAKIVNKQNNLYELYFLSDEPLFLLLEKFG
ncbi:MAG: hypothetical protein ACD_29C00189G0001, partial [uncultured bacterium]